MAAGRGGGAGAGAVPAGDGAAGGSRPVAGYASDTGGIALALVAPCGLPLALGCRRVWRLGYRRRAGWTWIALGAVTVAASVVAGLLGPAAIALYAAVLSLPVWAACWWLAHRG